MQLIRRLCRIKLRSMTLLVVCLLVSFVFSLYLAWTMSRNKTEALMGESDRTGKKSNVLSYQNAVVTTDSPNCAHIASNILRSLNGSVVDAAIAAIICEGVIHFHDSGLGGGGKAVVYIRSKKSVKSYDFTNAHRESVTVDRSCDKEYQILAVPCQMKGLRRLHGLYGSVTWSDIVTPTIAMCRGGFRLTSNLGDAIRQSASLIRESASLEPVMTNTRTCSLYNDGESIKLLKIARTLENTKDDEYGDVKFNGFLLDDLHDTGSCISESDIDNYTVDEKELFATTVMGHTIYTDLPSSLLTAAASLVKEFSGETDVGVLNKRSVVFQFEKSNLESFTRKIDVALKELLLKEYNKEHRAEKIKTVSDQSSTSKSYGGSSHVSVVDKLGNSISITSSLSTEFGSGIVGRRTGIIFDRLRQNVQRISSDQSLSPVIVFDSGGELKLLLGSSGRIGLDPLKDNLKILLNYLLMGDDMKRLEESSFVRHMSSEGQVLPSSSFHVIIKNSTHLSTLFSGEKLAFSNGH